MSTDLSAPEIQDSWRPPEFSTEWLTDAAGRSRVALAGELDIATVPQLDDSLRSAPADAPEVVLDLRELEFMDCSAAQLLLVADRRIRRAGGRLLIVRGPAEVEWLLELIGVDRQLEFVDEPPPGLVKPAL